MKTTNFKVKDRQIERLNYEPVIVGYQNVDTFHFDFDEEWEGLDKTLVFRVKDKKYRIALTNDEVVLPKQIYPCEGGFVDFGIYGKKEETVLTTSLSRIYIQEGVYEDEEIEELPIGSEDDIYIETKEYDENGEYHLETLYLDSIEVETITNMTDASNENTNKIMVQDNSSE